MSETVLPKDDAEPVVVKPEPLPDSVQKEPSNRRSSNGLAVLALLLGAAGVAVGGWSVWQLRAMQTGHQQQAGQLQDIGAQTQVLKQSEQQLAARLAALPPAEELEDRRRLVTQLQGDQQRLSQRLETVLGASRKDWRLAEAEHLLRLASLRLSALQDISSAQALVQGADEILREQDDPGAYAAREQLAKSMAALQSVDQPDRTGLFLQLAALRDQAAQLNALAPEYKDKGESLLGLTDGSEDSEWAKWWDKISQYFRVDFHADKNIRPLLAGQSLTQVRLSLSLALEQAQWAALNGQQQVYVQAVNEARSVLDANFNQDNPQSKSLGERLDALAKQPVSVATPDLTQSLSALQAYLEQRHKPVGGAAEQPSEEAKPGSKP
ncbi:uroporphyrinogen-III C-methyltransferase [Pseudomonas sp. GD03842]|uniref:uroporphyrinogen-III C-methyltransferase n=1 Tax=Pseudomonas sp. GD03842 TaxID=2975385 RepID=UPI002447D6C1|nr:uroporphyrinogen-III C-methyltransferase [Pseudomonas sp. GD03842]MDH0745888.1 uroporphyrinogen-III C-methyltransferase [Pseudomonas sp. GD03842]